MPFWQHISCRQVLLIFHKNPYNSSSSFSVSDVCAGAHLRQHDGSTRGAALSQHWPRPSRAPDVQSRERSPSVAQWAGATRAPGAGGRDVCCRPYACPETDPAQGETPRAGRARHGSGGPTYWCRFSCKNCKRRHGLRHGLRQRRAQGDPARDS